MRYRVVFMGTPDFAVPSLEALASEEDVVAVVTQPDKPRGRGLKLKAPPVKELAETLGIEVLQPQTLKDPAFLKKLKGLSPQLIVVAAYGKILPKEVLELPEFGCWNVHASLLPRYRGAAPIQWAIINRDEVTGVTIMQMDEGLDTGPMLLSRSVPLGEEETFGELSERLARLGAELLIEAIRAHKEGRLRPVPQPEEGVSYAPPLKKEFFRLDFSEPATRLCGIILAADPRPGAYTHLSKKVLKLFKPKAIGEDREAPPGTITSVTEEGLEIATGRGILFVREVQLEGKKRMPVREFLKGHPLSPGIRLGGD